jgi:chromosome segregation and condensation protein ScpB
LVERAENPADKRTFLYKPTADLLAHLGLSSIEQLPGYVDYSARLSKEAYQNTEAAHEEEPVVVMSEESSDEGIN